MIVGEPLDLVDELENDISILVDQVGLGYQEVEVLRRDGQVTGPNGEFILLSNPDRNNLTTSFQRVCREVSLKGGRLGIFYCGHGRRIDGAWSLSDDDVMTGEDFRIIMDNTILENHIRIHIVVNSCYATQFTQAFEPDVLAHLSSFLSMHLSEPTNSVRDRLNLALTDGITSNSVTNDLITLYNRGDERYGVPFNWNNNCIHIWPFSVGSLRGIGVLAGNLGDATLQLRRSRWGR
jgi:hypothetical protein